jgi:hypothetical protein
VSERAAPDGISVAAHPRTARAVARAKAWGGLAGLTLVGVLALRAGLPALDAMIRALAGGVAGYVATWMIAVAVGRQLVIAEVRARHAALQRAAQDAAAARADAA